ncbi:unnamed protein product [Caenorhabditis nigoni]
MREVAWSFVLALEVKNRFVNHTLVDGKDRYYTALDERDFENYFGKFLNDVKHISRGFDGYYSINSHYLFPLVYQIGCNNEFENATEQYCFLNHEAHMNDLFLFYGEAGTRCENGYENNNGLCKYTGTTTYTVSTTTVTQITKDSENDVSNEPSSSYSIFSLEMRLPLLALFIFPLVFSDWTGPEFMANLNEKRREFAKNESIPNMRELVWSDDLAQEVLVTKDMNPNEEIYIKNVFHDTYEEAFKTHSL